MVCSYMVCGCRRQASWHAKKLTSLSPPPSCAVFRQLHKSRENCGSLVRCAVVDPWVLSFIVWIASVCLHVCESTHTCMCYLTQVLLMRRWVGILQRVFINAGLSEVISEDCRLFPNYPLLSPKEVESLFPNTFTFGLGFTAPGQLVQCDSPNIPFLLDAGESHVPNNCTPLTPIAEEKVASQTRSVYTLPFPETIEESTRRFKKTFLWLGNKVVGFLPSFPLFFACHVATVVPLPVLCVGPTPPVKFLLCIPVG